MVAAPGHRLERDLGDEFAVLYRHASRVQPVPSALASSCCPASSSGRPSWASVFYSAAGSVIAILEVPAWSEFRYNRTAPGVGARKRPSTPRPRRGHRDGALESRSFARSMRAKVNGRKRAAFWRALGWPNLQRAWARNAEIRAARKRELAAEVNYPEAGGFMIDSDSWEHAATGGLGWSYASVPLPEVVRPRRAHSSENRTAPGANTPS